METATEDKTSLQIRRIYPQPVAAVYAAWSDPEQIKHWMGPSDDFGEAEVTIDVRVGGRYRYIMHAPDGEVHRVGGVFREVIANQAIQGELLAAILVLALLWWLYLQLPHFIQSMFRSLWRRPKKDNRHH